MFGHKCLFKNNKLTQDILLALILITDRLGYIFKLRNEKWYVKKCVRYNSVLNLYKSIL